jgi:hypothetical protein
MGSVRYKLDVMGKACSMHGDMRNVSKNLVCKLQGKKPVDKCRHVITHTLGQRGPSCSSFSFPYGGICGMIILKLTQGK